MMMSRFIPIVGQSKTSRVSILIVGPIWDVIEIVFWELKQMGGSKAFFEIEVDPTRQKKPSDNPIIHNKIQHLANCVKIEIHDKVCILGVSDTLMIIPQDLNSRGCIKIKRRSNEKLSMSEFFRLVEYEHDVKQYNDLIAKSRDILFSEAKRKRSQIELDENRLREERRKKEEAERRAYEEAERRAYEEKKMLMIEKRREGRLCIMCGKKMGFIERISKKEKHDDCADFNM